MLKLKNLSLAVVFGLSAVLVVGGTAGQVALAAELPAPDCRYDDVLTRYTLYPDSRKTLVDTIYALPRTYMPPPRLISTENAGLNGGEMVRRFVVADLAALGRAAMKAGTPLRVVSAYRSYKQQRYLYEREVRNKGLEAGRLLVARPGHSEHHLGTALDFAGTTDPKPAWKYEDWADSPAGAWLKANAWRYGFLMSYPDGYQEETCYQYEPWHYRYVGREMAADVRATGLTLREYLWKNYH